MKEIAHRGGMSQGGEKGNHKQEYDTLSQKDSYNNDHV